MSLLFQFLVGRISGIGEGSKNGTCRPKGIRLPKVAPCSGEGFLGREVFARLFEEQCNDQRGQSREESLELDFTNVSVHSRYGLRFHLVDLGHCKRVGTDLGVCSFDNVCWLRVQAHVPAVALRWNRGGKQAVS